MVAQAFRDKAQQLASQHDGFDADAMTYSGVFSVNAADLPLAVAKRHSGAGIIVTFLVSKQQAVIWVGGERFWAGGDDPVADDVFEQVVKPWIYEQAPDVFRFFQGLPDDTLTIDLFENE